MDRTLGFGPGDRGSIPRRLVIEYKYCEEFSITYTCKSGSSQKFRINFLGPRRLVIEYKYCEEFSIT